MSGIEYSNMGWIKKVELDHIRNREPNQIVKLKWLCDFYVPTVLAEIVFWMKCWSCICRSSVDFNHIFHDSMHWVNKCGQSEKKTFVADCWVRSFGKTYTLYNSLNVCFTRSKNVKIKINIIIRIWFNEWCAFFSV